MVPSELLVVLALAIVSTASAGTYSTYDGTDCTGTPATSGSCTCSADFSTCDAMSNTGCTSKTGGNTGGVHLYWYLVSGCTASPTPEPTPEQTAAPTTDDSSDKSCFGNDGEATAADGSTVKISDIQIGDKLHGDDEVWYIHEVEGEHKVLRIGTSSDNSLVLTPRHLLSTQQHGMAAASSVRVGDKLVGAKGPVQVVSIDTEKARVRSPITMSGTIIVDGVQASCYSDDGVQGVGTHDLMHQISIPFRALFHVSPALCLGVDNAIKPVFNALSGLSSMLPFKVTMDTLVATSVVVAISVPVVLPIAMYKRLAGRA